MMTGSADGSIIAVIITAHIMKTATNSGEEAIG
jgi:hypothetical protein